MSIHIITGRQRRGISTILGVLIFVGIMFTAYIPMLLVMKQADTIYTQKKLESERLDELRSAESVTVYTYPTGASAPNNLNVTVVNRGVSFIDVIRVWINDTYHSVNIPILPGEEKKIGSFNAYPVNDKNYYVKIATKNGNTFGASDSIRYDNGWEAQGFFIYVSITGKGTCDVELWSKPPVPNPPIFRNTTKVYLGGGSTVFTSFDVSSYGTNKDYIVKLKKGSSYIDQDEVSIDWPDGPAYIWAFLEG
jgi:hypothetical protein